MSTKPRVHAVPVPPRLYPTWTTYMWLGFAVATAVATLVGFDWSATRLFGL